MLYRTRILVASNFVQQSGRNARPGKKSLAVRSIADVGVLLFREEYLPIDSAFSLNGEPQSEAKSSNEACSLPLND